METCCQEVAGVLDERLPEECALVEAAPVFCGTVFATWLRASVGEMSWSDTKAANAKNTRSDFGLCIFIAALLWVELLVVRRVFLFRAFLSPAFLFQSWPPCDCPLGM